MTRGWKKEPGICGIWQTEVYLEKGHYRVLVKYRKHPQYKHYYIVQRRDTPDASVWVDIKNAPTLSRALRIWAKAMENK